MLSFQDYGVIIDEWVSTLPAEKQRKYLPRQARRVRSPRQTTDCNQETQDAFASTKTDFRAFARASAAIDRISRDRCDRYDTWVAVGMALCELGRVGFVLWDEWSKLSSKYDATLCAEKWPTFTPGDGLTLASLDAWANEDSAQQTPTDGCLPACPNRAKLAAHQETIRQLEQEITQLRDRNRFVTEAQGSKNIKSASLRDTVVELKKELDRIPLEDRVEGAFYPIRPSYMAACSNSSAPTVGRHLKKLEEGNYLERKIETTYDAEHQTWISQTFVRPLVDLTDPAILVIPSGHGGKRTVRCINPACNSTNIVDKVERICLDCKTPQDEVKYIPVNEVEDLRDEGDYTEAIAPASEDSQSGTQVRDFIMIGKEYVPDGMEPSEFQDEIGPPATVPAIIEDTLDLATAIRAADRYSPSDDAGRFAYKTALVWLNRNQPIKAEALLDRIHEPQARAIVAHLAGRP